MKKKIVFLSVLAAMSVSMTSCIDNDEPAGLEALRKGQAEKLQGEGAKYQAEAAYKLAEIALVEADAAAKQIANKISEVELAKKQLEVAVAEAASAVDIANYKTQLATAEGELEVAKLTAQANIVAAEDALADAKKDAAINAKNIEIALAQVKDPSTYTKVSTARAAVLTKEKAYTEAAKALIEAEKKLAQAPELLKKNDLQKVNDLEDAIETAKEGVVTAEFAVETAKINVEEFDALIEKDDAEWAKAAAEYAQEELKLKDADQAFTVELEALLQDYNVAKKPLDNAVTDAKKALTDAKDELNKDLKTFSDSAKYFSFELASAIAEDVTAPANFEIKGGKLVSSETIKNSEAATKLADLKSYAQGKADAATAEIVAAKNIDLTKLQNMTKDLKTTADADVKDYTEKLAAYKTALGTSEEASKKSDFDAASNKAYGELRYTAFTTDELADMHKNHTLSGKGTYGAYQETLLAIADLQKEIGQANGWNALNNAVKSELKTIDDKTAAYNAKIDQASLNKLVDAVAAAEKAVTDLTKKYNDDKTPIANAQSENAAKLSAVQAMKTAVEGVIKVTALSGEGEYRSEADIKNAIASAKQALVDAVASAERTVLDKEVKVAEAEKELEMHKAGLLTIDMSVEAAQKAVDDAKATAEKAKAEYDEAVAALDTILAAIKA